MSIELIHGRKPDYSDESIKRLIADRKVQKDSIRTWLSMVNDSDLFAFTSEFHRSGNAGPLHITSHQGRGYVAGEHFFDCANSLVLRSGPKDSFDTPSACIGFDVVPDDFLSFPLPPPEFSRRGFGINPGDVIISQIQSIPDERNKLFLQSWRWEQALVTLVADWVQFAELGKLYIWPGQLIGEDFPETSEKVGGFMRRYNGTARALGFRKNPKGIYVLDEF